MKIRRIAILITPLLIIAGGFAVLKLNLANNRPFHKTDDENEDKQASYTILRARYMFDMMKDPVTGKIPRNIIDEELSFARSIPEKGSDPGIASRVIALNTYFPAGPNNQGGRTRAVAYDVRYNGTSNQVILAGCVSGGIMRSSDGGATWTRVSPDNEIHNVSSIVQDPRPGNQDIWYAGGGEPNGSSTDENGAVYFGYGLYKSINNGVTWTKITLSGANFTDIPGNVAQGNVLEAFDNAFDYIHKLAIDPTNGNVYICGHRRLIRTTNGGTSFQTVFGSNVGAIAIDGQMDVAISGTGKIILAVNGGNPDLTLRGVWTSSTGNLNNFTRIAGGINLGTDSVAGWRANSYDVIPQSTFPIPKRVLLAMAPSNQNIVYVVYENGLSNTSPDNAPEADMYKLDMTSGNVWTNLSANMPDFPGGNLAATDPFAIQEGYDLFIAVKPDDPNFVLLGGTSLYRSTDGFASTTNTSWIGGYGNTLPTLTFYANSHPDIHNAVFSPVNFNEVICANDGGMQITNDITAPASTVAWSNINNYQTLQYYYVAVDPETGRNNFIGGAQDNGTQLRDKTGITGVATSDSNNHRRVLGGDGCASGFGKINGSNQFVYAGVQLGSIRRALVQAGLNSGDFTTITPTGLTENPFYGSSAFGEFVTNFRLNPDNTEDLYYVNFNRLFRTNNASTVNSGSWTELTGVGAAVNPSDPTDGTNVGIRALAFSRGPYITSHALYIGTTSGKIFRFNDPRNAAAGTTPVDITPSSLPLNSNVQDIAVNPNNDDEIMAIVSNYNVVSIWWTNNAKAASPTWRNAEGNLTLPSIRSCMIVVKKDASNNPVTEYYIGTSVGLYSASDIGPVLLASGSPTWQREGGSVLNFAVVQSLSYRPADNVMLAGTHGNGLYYTFLGTPNFNPNPSTGTIDPNLNNKNFIRQVFPTITTNDVQFKTGTLFSIKNISIQVFNLNGQIVVQKERAYADGSVDISNLSRGAYILSIYSDNRKYRHLVKIIKQ